MGKNQRKWLKFKKCHHTKSENVENRKVVFKTFPRIENENDEPNLFSMAFSIFYENENRKEGNQMHSKNH